MWVFVEKVTNRIILAGRGGVTAESRFDREQGTPIEIPDQDDAWLYEPVDARSTGTVLPPRSLRSDLYYPQDVPLLYSAEEKALRVDGDTDAAIGSAIHPVAPIGEQIGILREQLVQVLNALGIEATVDFARLNSIAVEAIEAARAKKGVLDA